MSAYGGHRSGSGRKRMFASKNEYNQVWRKGHRRVWLDNIIYSSWVSAKLKCGYNSDTTFAAHLLSLEQRRREYDPVISCAKAFTSNKGEVTDGPSPKRRRSHFEGEPVSTSTPVKPGIVSLDLPNLTGKSIDNTSDSDVDVTGISEFAINNSSYHVANDSVILKSDTEKYQDSDESVSEYEAAEVNESALTHALEDALKELDEDLQQLEEHDSYLSDSSDVDDLELSLRMLEHDSDFGSSDSESMLDVEIHASDIAEQHAHSQVTAANVIHSAIPPMPQFSMPTCTAIPASHPQSQASVPFTIPASHPQSQASVPFTIPASHPQSSPSVPVTIPVSHPQSQPSVPVTIAASHPQSQPSVPVTIAASHPQSQPSVPVTIAASHPQSQPSVPVTIAASHPQSQPSVPVTIPVSHPQSSPSVPVTNLASHPQTQPSSPATNRRATCIYPKLSRLEEQHLFTDELAMVRETKFICSLDLVLPLFRKCQHPGCANTATIKHHLIGPTLVVNWSCPTGHKGKFASSKDVNEMYANNLQVAASVLISGNNFAKIEKMANFLGLSFISDSTFYRMQRLYLIPSISEWWSWQREQLIQEFAEKEIVVCGDGQCDSPGHSAKNLCYFLMELVSGYILEVEVRDKRHVGLASSNMEKQALQNSLQRLQQSLNIVEIVTDASSSIKKLIADNFATVFHSLDVWHKSKSIRKCLAKVGNLKNMDKVKAWSDHIVLHFWHCANICKPDESTSDNEALQKMKSTWIGVLHHVCNEHEWTGGKCGHDELDEHNLPWFDRRDKDFEALQKIILDSQLLESFKFYVRFRHTGRIECANSLSLVYTPKRCSYSYRAYKARKLLAAIDWNFHSTQETATTKGGDLMVTRKYNQRTKEWNSVLIKVKKKYEYIPVLMAKIMRMRLQDVDVVTRNVSLNESDPALLAPTIAAKPAPPSKELYLAKKTRFRSSDTEANPQTTSNSDDL